MTGPNVSVFDADSRVAPPRRNGELVFATPAESRLFGVTLALHEAGAFDWEEFRKLLIAEIGEAEQADAPWSYYGAWQRALEELLVAKGLIDAASLEARTRDLGSRTVGHDHA